MFLLDSCLALASPTSCAEDGGCTIANWSECLQECCWEYCCGSKAKRKR